MNLGLLPGLGGGLKTTAASGQAERFIRYYLEQYAHAFEQIYFFSYHSESLADYTQTDHLLRQVKVVPPVQPMHYRRYTLQMARLTEGMMRQCQVLRVFQATGAFPAVMAQHRYGLPFVMTYGYKYHTFARIEGHHVMALLLRLWEPWALKRATAVIVTTTELHQYVSKFTHPNKIHLIPNGVDTQLFDLAPQVVVDEPPTILFIGRFTPQKNLPLLLQAAAQLKSPIRLKFIGDGPLRKDLENQAQSLDIQVEFHGVVPHQELPTHLQNATLFVLPSLTEGHPKALIEAMSCGLPCVASDSNGNRLLIQHGQTGLLFESNDVQSLIKALMRFLEDKAYASACGQAARQYIKQNLDIHNLLAQEITLLKNVGRAS
jgi:glycosyltransferase involved in cell wall biosynthesis